MATSLVQADIVLIFVALAVYVAVVWFLMAISMFLVFTRPNDVDTERKFEQSWYSWRKQYIWHEIWYRLHVIALSCIVVIFAYESSSLEAWMAVVIFIIVLLVTVSLKYASRSVSRRVPTDL